MNKQDTFVITDNGISEFSLTINGVKIEHISSISYSHKAGELAKVDFTVIAPKGDFVVTIPQKE